MKRYTITLSDKAKMLLAYLAFIGLVIALNSCSSVRKQQTKYSSNVDSVQVKSTSIELKKDSIYSRKIDSIGSLIKDSKNEYEREIFVEYDTAEDRTGSVNGTSNDYVTTRQRIKSIQIKERGTGQSKEVQTASKKVDEAGQVSSLNKANTSDSTALSKKDTSSSSSKTKVSPMWLLLLIPLVLLGFVIYVKFFRKKSTKHFYENKSKRN